MTYLKTLVSIIKNWLDNAHAYIKRARLDPNAFTRKGKITDEQLLLYMLTNTPHSISESLISLYAQLEIEADDVPTKQALSQKRKLIDESPLEELFLELVSYVYQQENRDELKTRNGMLPVGIDGTKVNIPNNPMLKKQFGTLGRGKKSCAARGSVAFDLLNKFSLDALLRPLKVGERRLAEMHLQRVSKIVPAEMLLYVMDRGYFSQRLFKKIDDAGSKFLCRCPVGTCHAVDDAATEDIVRLDNGLLVKVIKIKLESGVWETLVTNDLEMDEVEACELYNLRWGIEENYKIIKNHLHLECFSGCTRNVVFQEFYAVMVNSILLSALGMEADRKIEQKKDNKYKYVANRNRCEKALRANLVRILVAEDDKELSRLYANLMAHSLRDTVPVRPGRKFGRKTARATRYHSNMRYH